MNGFADRKSVLIPEPLSPIEVGFLTAQKPFQFLERICPSMSQFVSPYSQRHLSDFCDQWGVKELALFGSAVRREMGPDSDLDFLVTFVGSQEISLLDLAEMEMELEKIYGREVELVSRAAVERSENAIRRTEILKSAQPIFQRDAREPRSSSS